MKTPRITDFDPEAKLPSLKSSLDNMPAIQKPGHNNPPQSPIQPIKPTIIKNQPVVQPLKDKIKKPAEKPKKRAIRTRHPFDIYEDQYIDLRRLSLEMQIEGIQCSMSQMVREALDRYLSAKKKEIK